MADQEPRRVSLVLGSSTGGVGQHLRSVVPRLTGRYVVTVVGPRATDDLFGFSAAAAAFRAVEIPADLGPRDAATVRRLRIALDDAELVHAHGLRAGLLAGLAAHRRVPLVCTLHNALITTGWRRRVSVRLERRVVRRADVTLGASEDLVDSARRLGASDARLAPVAAPVAPSPERPPIDVKAGLGAAARPLVVSVGRLHPQKGYDTLVAAAVRLAGREPPPLFVVAGDGPLDGYLRSLVAAMGAPVRLLGRRADVADLLAAADVVALPSVWEARSLVAQEAMQLGRPLVATRVGGLPGLVEDGAVLVPPGDADALADALAGLLDEPQAAARLGRRAAEVAAGWPTEDDTAAQLVTVYDELLARAAAR